jgi:diacylglycerol kinase family enzyme
LPEKTGSDGPDGERIYVEADGELLGRLPARMTMVRDALSLIIPA